MAGMTSHQVKVGVYNPSTGKTIYLNAGDPTDRYFTNISWSPDEKSIYLIELNRDQNHAVLCQYDATTGKLLGKLLEETHPKYVEPQHPIVFLPWDNSKFIYQSQRDGYNHLYLCDLTSSLKGEWKSDAAGGKAHRIHPDEATDRGQVAGRRHSGLQRQEERSHLPRSRWHRLQQLCSKCQHRKAQPPVQLPFYHRRRT